LLEPTSAVEMQRWNGRSNERENGSVVFASLRPLIRLCLWLFGNGRMPRSPDVADGNPNTTNIAFWFGRIRLNAIQDGTSKRLKALRKEGWWTRSRHRRL
jgi:hypothetical protein